MEYRLRDYASAGQEHLAACGSEHQHGNTALALPQTRGHVAAAREEERRRLRRDLHDGLGPMLAAVAMQADTARELVDSDPGAAKVLLARLTEQTQSLLGEVRRLVYALRPPTLDRLGLPGAIRSLISAAVEPHVQVWLEAPAPFPGLPAAVELAAYRIIQEALTNVVRHARAQQCGVRLQVAADLLIEVIDDGCGLPPQPRPGLGLSSMRERARELGGECYVQQRWAGGTRVFAWLPLD